MRAFLSLLIGAVLLGGCAAKPTAGETTANAAKPTISDGLKSMTSESSPALPASEDYERAVANYTDCVHNHTANLTACEKQRAIMDGLGFEVDTTDEAREILQLKGGYKVAF